MPGGGDGEIFHIVACDMAGGLRMIDDLDRGGKDLRRLVLELLEHFRNLLVFQHLGGQTEALDVTPEQLGALERQASLADSSRVLRIAEHLADLDGRIRHALSRRTLLETVFVRCCRAATTATIDQLIRDLAAWQNDAAVSGDSPMPAVPPPPPPAAKPAAPPAATPPPPPTQSASSSAATPAPPAANPGPASSRPAVVAPPVAPSPAAPPYTAAAPARPTAVATARSEKAAPAVPPVATVEEDVRTSPLDDQGVKAALELFGARIVQVDNGKP